METFLLRFHKQNLVCGNKFITAKLSIRKPGSSSVDSANQDMDIIRIESSALVLNLRGVSTNKILYVLSPCKPTTEDLVIIKTIKVQSVIIIKQ